MPLKPDEFARRDCGGQDDWLVVDDWKTLLREHLGRRMASGLDIGIQMTNK